MKRSRIHFRVYTAWLAATFLAPALPARASDAAATATASKQEAAPSKGAAAAGAISVLQGVLGADPGAIPPGAERPLVGKARLGASLDEVRKAYPEMKALDRENLGAAPVFNPRIKRFVVRGATIEGLPKPVDLELRFWDDKLWVVIVYPRDNGREVVQKHLEERFGEPSGTVSLTWKGDAYLVSLPGGLAWYSVTDRAVATEVQTWFAAEIRKALEARKKAQEKKTSGEGAPQQKPVSKDGGQKE